MILVPDISKRSFEKELIDGPGIPESEMIRNIKELDIFNLLTGNIFITLKLLETLIHDRNKEYHLADLGCGGGEFLIRADRWAKRKKLRLTLSGVDNNTITISHLTGRLKGNENITPIKSDYRTFLLSSSQNVDIIHCSLFMHHLDDYEIIELIKTAKEKKAILIINDLLRSKVAYYAAKALTRIFNGTYLAKHDGPLSVLKGFKIEELKGIIAETGSRLRLIRSIPFFRCLIVIAPD